MISLLCGTQRNRTKNQKKRQIDLQADHSIKEYRLEKEEEGTRDYGDRPGGSGGRTLTGTVSDGRNQILSKK